MKITCMLGVATLVLATSHASNVTLNKPATLNGSFFTSGGTYYPGYTSSAATVTDGLFVPAGTVWYGGTIWWTEGDSPGATVEIDLQGTFTIESLVVQADDNDAYLLEYYDPQDGLWKTAWDVPNADFVNGVNVFGMQTRPNPQDETEQYILPAPIIASALRFSGKVPPQSDGAFSVSEIQAYGYELIAGDVDIKPGSDVNPLNVKAKGVLPVAVLGSDTLDVTSIDASSALLSDVSPLRWAYEDVNEDGFDDLTLKFSNQEVVTALGPVADGDLIDLPFSAWLEDGSLLLGSDKIWVISKQ